LTSSRGRSGGSGATQLLRDVRRGGDLSPQPVGYGALLPDAVSARRRPRLINDQATPRKGPQVKVIATSPLTAGYIGVIIP